MVCMHYMFGKIKVGRGNTRRPDWRVNINNASRAVFVCCIVVFFKNAMLPSTTNQ